MTKFAATICFITYVLTSYAQGNYLNKSIQDNYEATTIVAHQTLGHSTLATINYRKPQGTDALAACIIVDSSGKVVQRKEIGFHNGQTTVIPDLMALNGSFYTVGLGSDSADNLRQCLVKINNDGIPSNPMDFALSNMTEITSMAVGDSARIYIAGNGQYYNSALIACLDTTGKVLWEKSYSGKAKKICCSPNGDVYLAGIAYDYISSCVIDNFRYNSYEDVLILKTDYQGKVKWRKVMPTSCEDYVYACAPRHDGGVLVLARREHGVPFFKPRVIAMDENGVIIFDHEYFDALFSFFVGYDIISLPNNKSAFCGSGFLYIINENGDSLHLEKISPAAQHATAGDLTNLTYSQNLGFTLTGSHGSNYFHQPSLGWLVKTDTNGCQQPCKTSSVKEKHSGHEETPLFNVYPSPFRSELTIEIDPHLITTGVTLQIYAASGELVYEGSLHNNISHVATNNWKYGIYFVYIINDYVSLPVVKIVKQ